MKKSILSISVFSLIIFSFLISGCKKQPKKPVDPCRNAVTVMAAETYDYYSGHFKTSNPADNSVLYLYANNWNQYASQVVPGRHYKIAYTEVPCNRDRQYHSGIKEGGCVIYPNKCIKILCLQELKLNTCFETLVFPKDFEQVYSTAISSTGITGDALNAKVSFSGCSPNDAIKFKLYAEQKPDMTMGPLGMHIWEVKAVNVNQDMTCQAVFTKETCFDLSSIKTHYMTRNSLPPENIKIRLMTGSTYQEFTYNLK